MMPETGGNYVHLRECYGPIATMAFLIIGSGIPVYVLWRRFGG